MIKEAQRNGKTVICITGTLSQPRNYFKQKIEEAGQLFGTSITGNTDYLVVGEKPGSKVDKAKAAGTKIIKEEEFLDLLEDLKEHTVVASRHIKRLIKQ